MTKKVFIRLIGGLMLIAVLVVSMVFVAHERSKAVCGDIAINFTETYNFITDKEVQELIEQKLPGLSGTRLDTLNSERVERVIEKHPWVKNAEVFKGYSTGGDSLMFSGRINVRVTQRQPIARIVDLADARYIDAGGAIIPVSLNHSEPVPVFTGNINIDSVDVNILNFANYIYDQPFWSALILQVDVKNNNEVVLVSRLGGYKIEFGTLENKEEKFRNLKAVLEKGFPKNGWKDYEKISLKFKNQVVCTLK